MYLDSGPLEQYVLYQQRCVQWPHSNSHRTTNEQIVEAEEDKEYFEKVTQGLERIGTRGLSKVSHK